MMKPVAVDLFSGSGGLTLGLRQAGFRVAGAVEMDPLAVETYRANHKKTIIWSEDIRKVSIQGMMRRLGIRRGELDLLAGCPPCQGFSTMTTLNGRRKMRNDPRNDLVLEFLRFVYALRPKAVMLENVPGLANDERMQNVAAELKRLGYRCTTGILNAADYGVPQRRRRFILLAGLRKTIPFGNQAAKRQSVRESLQCLTNGLKADPLHKVMENRSARIRKLIRSIPANGGSRRDAGSSSQLKCHRSCDGFKDVYGRMSWDDVAPTITGGCFNPSKGRFLHPTLHRAITLREAALLQSFPRNYYFSLRRGKCHAAQLIGNALPPAFIRSHARAVIRHIRPN